MKIAVQTSHVHLIYRTKLSSIITQRPWRPLTRSTFAGREKTPKTCHSDLFSEAIQSGPSQES